MKAKAQIAERSEPRIALNSRAVFSIVAALALVGLGISSYLTYVRFTGGSLVCGVVHGCNTVQSSPYAEVLGIPIGVMGLGIYTAILAMALAGVLRHRDLGEVAALGLFGVGLGGTIYSAYLTWVEIYRIEALCIWCLISAGIMVLTLVLAVVNLVIRSKEPLPR